jgi:hypothetical protein
MQDISFKSQKIRTIRYCDLSSSQIDFLDSGGVLHVQDYPLFHKFLSFFRDSLLQSGHSKADVTALFDRRDVPSMRFLGAMTRALKIIVRNHGFAMFAVPLIKRIGCELHTTHLDSGVIRYQLQNGLRALAKSSGEFEEADFKRIDPSGFPEIFGYHKLPPHRDVRWPHIRIIGCWMPLTDLAAGETVSIFPEAFSKNEALGDPNLTPTSDIESTDQFGLGHAISPAMSAGDVLIFHAASVHSSPIRQLRTFRGSIDWRIAYPCVDDFKHYKSTFVQCRNLICLKDNPNTINLNRPRSKSKCNNFRKEIVHEKNLPTSAT